MKDSERPDEPHRPRDEEAPGPGPVPGPTSAIDDVTEEEADQDPDDAAGDR